MSNEDYRKYVDKDYFHKGLVKYTSRDYESIMEDFWEMVPKLTELWKPAPDKYKVSGFYDDSDNEKEVWNPEANADPGVILGKFLASCADMLGVNLDWLANEVYAPSVSQRKNAQRIFSLIGYELGWYTAARTEVTFVNTSDANVNLDFGFNGANFCTLNAYTDISGNSRVITYNILPLTSTYGDNETRGSHNVTSSTINVFADSDEVSLAPGDMVTRVAIEGELRSYSISVEAVKKNNYTIVLPSQHVDTTAIWIKAKTSKDADEFLDTQWVQCSNPSEFTQPEPRFAVTYDFYSNAQVQISNYLNQLENYDNNYLTVYWFDCMGVIGCVGEDVLTNYLQANPSNTVETSSFAIHNLSNTVEWPHTNTVTGKSPETAREAYLNSRNYINTFDSLVTLPDYNRFLNREPGVDCGLVIDCQKALEINLSIYRDENLTDDQKAKMYINNYDFPAGEDVVDWYQVLDLERSKTKVLHVMTEGETLADVAERYGVTVNAIIQFNNITNVSTIKVGDRIRIPGDYDADAARVFISNFKTYTAMCFAVYNDFQNGSLGMGKVDPVRIKNRKVFYYYRPPEQFCYDIIRDYRPLQAMTTEIEFGNLRVFDFYVVGQIYLKKQVKRDVANNIIAKVKENLALYFAPANRKIGEKPTVMEVVKVIQGSDSRIEYFDAGSINNPVINWKDCNPDYWNYISFARFKDPGTTADNIRIAPSSLIG